MSYLPLNALQFADGPVIDAFGRLRVSEPYTVFDSQQEYTYGPFFWDHFTASGGTATYTQVQNATLLSTAGTGSGARALRQTKTYWRYQPGKSHLVLMTGTLTSSGTHAGASFAHIGYNDDNNGVFFSQTSAGVGVNIRSDVSGSVVNTTVLQSSWNLDKFNGTGPSGLTLDFTKEQIFVIDLQWLGAGRVRFGFEIAGQVQYCHQFLNANTIANPYMRTACLPIRYEVFNSGGTGANVTLKANCCSIQSEGGVSHNIGYTFGFENTAAVTVNTTFLPIWSVRVQNTFQGITYRGQIHPIDIPTLVKTNDVIWQIRINATLTGATFANTVDANSGLEYDTAATVVSGGTVVEGGYFAAGAGSLRIAELSPVILKRPLARTYDNVRDIATLCCRSISGNADVYAGFNYEEEY